MTTEPSKPPKLFTAPFVISTVLLGAAAVLAGPVNGWLKVRLIKQALPLRAPLGSLDEASLAPYRVLNRHALAPEFVEALGTSNYLLWTLEDPTEPAESPLRTAQFFVTYYSGGPNLVPHTPDVCYLGGGYQQAQPHENFDLPIPSLAPGPTEVPVRVLTFAKTSVFRGSEISVVYTFGCNGRFAGGRERIRQLINEPRNRYAYFSKVEVSFHGASRAQTIAGAEKLFRVALPVLFNRHWPDFDAAEKSARADAN